MKTYTAPPGETVIVTALFTNTRGITVNGQYLGPNQYVEGESVTVDDLPWGKHTTPIVWMFRPELALVAAAQRPVKLPKTSGLKLGLGPYCIRTNRSTMSSASYRGRSWL